MGTLPGFPYQRVAVRLRVGDNDRVRPEEASADRGDESITELVAGRRVRAGLARAAALATVICCATAFGDSATETRARALHAQGVRHYNLAEYDLAIEVFKQAYALTPFPGLLFNIAQAYRHQGECGRALEFYRSYLRQKPTAADRAEVERHLREMEACVGERARAAPASQAASSPVRPETEAAAAAAPARSQGPSHRLLTWTLLGSGVAAAASGGVLLGLVSHGLDACSPACSPSRIDDLKLEAAFGYALVVAGAAAIAAGVLVYGLDRRRRTERVGIALIPGPAAVVLLGRFR